MAIAPDQQIDPWGGNLPWYAGAADIFGFGPNSPLGLGGFLPVPGAPGGGIFGSFPTFPILVPPLAGSGGPSGGLGIPGPTAPPRPIDPYSGLPQEIVDQLWAMDPPEGVPLEAQVGDPVKGLPKWIVSRITQAGADRGVDPWEVIFQGNGIPDWLTAILVEEFNKIPNWVETWNPETGEYKISTRVEGQAPPEQPPPEQPPTEPPGQQTTGPIFVPETGPPIFRGEVRRPTDIEYHPAPIGGLSGGRQRPEPEAPMPEPTPTPPVVPGTPVPPPTAPPVTGGPPPVVPAPVPAPAPTPTPAPTPNIPIPGGGGGLASILAAGPGAPVPGGFAPVVGSLGAVPSLFQVPPYAPLLAPAFGSLMPRR